MALRDLITGWLRGAPAPRASTQSAGGGTAYNLNDPQFLEYMRGSVSTQDALKNSAVFRSVDLISGVMGSLPLVVVDDVDGVGVEPALRHPLYSLLAHRPNGWQNAFQFKQLVQHWALVHGNGYALIVRSGGRIVAMHPLAPNRVRVEQNNDFSLRYEVTRPDGSYSVLPASDVLHIRGPSEDGIRGVSRVRLAADIIEIGVKTQRAAERVFTNGMLTGGSLTVPGKLSPEAYGRLVASMEARSGPENAGKWIITEEGMEAKPFAQTAVDAQLVELRAALVEDIGRVFGVPRPLLGVDETSWGSGIEQLAILFVRFGLAPWFKAWEDEIKVKCLPPAEWNRYRPDFQERELLRGTIKEQFEAYAKAAGAGGHRPWMEPNEIRADLGLGMHADGAGLRSAGEATNEQAATVQAPGV
jgi:HK97 family phage portal protein